MTKGVENLRVQKIVERARKEWGECYFCGKPISRGEEYVKLAVDLLGDGFELLEYAHKDCFDSNERSWKED